MAATKKAATEIIEIRPIEIAKVQVKIVGDTPLIVHAWSEKAKKMMLEAQMGTKKGKAKEKRNPEEDFIDSMYWLTTKPAEKTMEAFNEAVKNGAKFGFPATAVKQAAVSAAFRMGWSKDKMGPRGAFFIEADENGMLEIHSDAPIMREDTVRIGLGSADLRYRGEFRNWSMDLIISYNKNGQYSIDNILSMINGGGYICGIGEWRPERDGQNGQFHIE